MTFKRVVVTGLGALTPIGNDVPTYWSNLAAGVSGAGPITKFDASKFRTQFACEIKGLDVTQHIPRQDARKMDAFTHYALIATDEAIRDAGVDVETLDRNKVGVIWGSGIGGLKSFEDEMIDYARGDGTPRINPFFIVRMIADSASGQISMRYGFRGTNYVTVSACASTNNAIIDALNYIRLGRLKMCVVGGSEAAVTRAGIGGFNANRALSERNDSPETASRPYDKGRDGFVLGEGAGALILEEYEHAQARGAKIYAELIGGGMSSDAYHITAPHPEGLGAFLAMQDALEDAGIEPSSIDYINTHGTSTPIGDPQELKAIYQLFGDHSFKLNISSTKSMTGHLLGAAGAVEAIAAIKAIEHQLVPPTINYVTPDEEIDSRFNLTANTAQARSITTVMSNAFGFGGHNAIVIFRKLS
ncbi:beta-ketoacyl-ACP synthase II [Spirosoma utsteinense]|uniref:3-oxoacyl-[acyl-carrier-protein] synthase 2 n=1 Tax=Spirosoma utsteinense TaxID=2585773 RepID=A0ABR6W4S5_9BACT|nr:beta-ketoacyl-ACP synthase II [Spirosoma utsteinense]MBC3784820.1 3-oxoacyl-[acyl-carrier-protein] synthase II [Spirosoma utsteinense]MBC3791143.1 3-oxoacyl-[acyl-carrier-protein] synthase II [Spirosoma utsteinense]